MPTLVLPPRYTPDSIALWGAAIHRRHPRRGLLMPHAAGTAQVVRQGRPLSDLLRASRAYFSDC